jgi:2-methylisocitrate lyase-like PEP mutase family enzyme
VIPVEEYLPKLQAALQARGSAPFHVTARTDAAAVFGLDEAIRRAKLYRDAGADAVFVEAPRDIEALERVRDEVRDVTLVANMVEQGKTPILPANTLFEMGYAIIAVPVAGLLATSFALTKLLTSLKEHGSTQAELESMNTFHALNSLLGLEALYERERGWN